MASQMGDAAQIWGSHMHHLSFGQRPLRKILRELALSASAMTVLTVATPIVQAQSNTRTFSIGAQPLLPALQNFTEQSGIQIGYAGTLGDALSSPGVSGTLPPAEALSRLLTGTGLTYRFTSPTAVTLEPAPRGADGTIQLGPVRVAGEGGASAIPVARSLTSDPVATEGTRSYTATGPTTTATGMALALRDTPQSVSIITRQKMDDQNVLSLDDIARTATGITYTKIGTDRSTYYARGSEITDIQYDGIPTNISESYSMDVMSTANMAIYDRVEVVRGANGLLQGTGNPSATINLVRKRATHTFQLSGEAGVGSWANYRGQVDVSGPLARDGDVRARAVAYYNNAGSFRDGASKENKLLYLTGEADLSHSTTLRVGTVLQHDYNYGYDWGGLNTDTNGNFYNLPRSASLAGSWAYLKRRNYSAFADLEQQLGSDWKIVLSGNAVWSNADFLSSYPSRSSGDTYRLVVSNVAYRDRQTGANIYATGHYRLLGGEHQLMLGGSLRRDTFDYVIRTATNTPSVDITNYDYVTIAAPLINPASATYYGYRRKEEGLYASTRLTLTGRLHAILGTRISWADYKVSSPYTNDRYRTNGRAIPYAGVIYDVARNHSLYASFTDVYKTQSYYGTGNKLLNPVQGKNYEAGVKGAYWDGRLNASLALFEADLVNMPEATTAAKTCGVTGTSSCYIEGGKVRSRGVEMELSGSPLPGWNATVGYTYADPTYVAGANTGTGYNTRLPRSLFKLSSDYRLPGKLDRLRLGGDLYVQSRSYTQTSTYLINQGGYALLNLHANIDINRHVSASVNLNNVFDKTYYQSIPTSNNYGGAYFGDPRNVMFTLRGRL